MADPPSRNDVDDLLARAREFDEMTRQSQRLRQWIERIRSVSQEWPSVSSDSEERPQSPDLPKPPRE